MNILFLLSEEERALFPKGLLAEDIVLRTDKTVLESVLAKNPKHVFITRSYVETHGEDSVLKAIKTIELLTESSIKYLVHEDSIDKIIQHMAKVGYANIYKIRVHQISLTKLNTMLAHKYTKPQLIETDSTKKEKIKIMVNELTNMDNEMLYDFLKSNKYKLIDSLRSYVSAQETVEEQDIKIHELGNIIDLLEKKISMLAKENNSLKMSNETTLRELRELRRDVLKHKDIITEYNSAIRNSKIIDTPIVKVEDSGPIIIYFKEIEDIGFKDFYESIYYTLTEVYKLYTKSIILEKSGRHFFDPYTDDGYILTTATSKKPTVIDNDKLIRYGNPTSVLKLLLSPENRLEVLLVFDRTGSENILIDSDNLIPFYLGNSRSYIKTLDINDISFISPVEGKWKEVRPLMRRSKPDKTEILSYKVHCSRHPFTNYLLKLIQSEV